MVNLLVKATGVFCIDLFITFIVSFMFANPDALIFVMLGLLLVQGIVAMVYYLDKGL